MNTNRVIILLLTLFISMSFYGQSKLTREQVLNAVRTHQNIADSVKIEDTDTIKCDARTTEIVLTVYNDSTAEGCSYNIVCNKDGVELSIFEKDIVVFRSCYEYSEINYYKLKSKVNNLQIVKIASIKDDYYQGIDMVLRFYRNDKMYESIESFSSMTNVSKEFHELATTIISLVPSIKDVKNSLECALESDVPDSVNIELSFSEETVKFKSKGGEFKKVKVTCNIEDWSIVECPDWITCSLNKNDEIVLESQRNDEKKQREGDVVVQCDTEKKSIHIIQLK